MANVCTLKKEKIVTGTLLGNHRYETPQIVPGVYEK